MAERKKQPKEDRRGLFNGPPKSLFDDYEDEIEVRVRGPLFPRLVFYALLTVFGISLMLTVDWFGLLLLNAKGVFRQIGVLNALRVMAALMTGISIPSVLLMLHYKFLYSYTSEENVFFATTFSISFMLGLPCALAFFFA